MLPNSEPTPRFRRAIGILARGVVRSVMKDAAEPAGATQRVRGSSLERGPPEDGSNPAGKELPNTVEDHEGQQTGQTKLREGEIP